MSNEGTKATGWCIRCGEKVKDGERNQSTMGIMALLCGLCADDDLPDAESLPSLEAPFILEYDGAFKCGKCGAVWGAISGPKTGPCEHSTITPSLEREAIDQLATAQKENEELKCENRKLADTFIGWSRFVEENAELKRALVRIYESNGDVCVGKSIAHDALVAIAQKGQQ